MSSGVDLDSSAFERALADRLRRLRDNSKQEERRLAETTADRMRDLVPRDTSETAASIQVVDGPNGSEITMGGASLFLIFGTSKMAPQDFARPAIAEASSRFRVPSFH